MPGNCPPSAAVSFGVYMRHIHSAVVPPLKSSCVPLYAATAEIVGYAGRIVATAGPWTWVGLGLLAPWWRGEGVVGNPRGGLAVHNGAEGVDVGVLGGGGFIVSSPPAGGVLGGKEEGGPSMAT